MALLWRVALYSVANSIVFADQAKIEALFRWGALMNDFWHEEEGSEWDKSSFEYYDERLHKDEKTLGSKKSDRVRLLLIIGFGLCTVIALVLGLVFGLGTR